MKFVRQGDVPIIPATIPSTATEIAKDARGRVILAWGEVTGHHHRFEDGNGVALLEADGTRYLRINDDAVTTLHPVSISDDVDDRFARIMDASGVTIKVAAGDVAEYTLGAEVTLPGRLLVHEEHDAILVAPGTYRVPGQKEYVAPEIQRRVAD